MIEFSAKLFNEMNLILGSSGVVLFFRWVCVEHETQRFQRIVEREYSSSSVGHRDPIRIVMDWFHFARFPRDLGLTGNLKLSRFWSR